MLIRQKIFLIPFLLILITACRSSQQRQPGDPFHSDSAQVPFEMDHDEPSSMPNFLWSPSRRRASAGFFYLVAEYKAMSGDMKNASRLYEATYNLDPNPFVAAKLVGSQALSGQQEQALTEARRLVLLYPKSARLRLMYGQLLLRSEDADHAEKELLKAKQLDPKDEAIAMSLIEIYLVKKNLSRAIEVAKEFTDAVPDSAPAWSRLARLYLVNGDKKRALEPAQRAYELSGTDPENVLIMAVVYEANSESQKAIALYENLYRLNPNNQELLAKMAEIYRSLGSLDEALELLNELSRLPNGDGPGVQLQRAVVLWELKKFNEAAEILEALAETHADNPRIQYLAGVGHERTNELDRALERYKKVARGNEYSLPARIRTVAIFNAQKKNKEAALELTEIEKTENVDQDFFVFAAAMAFDSEKASGALNVIDRGLKKFPGDTRLLFLRAVYLEKNKDFKACVATLRELLEKDAEHASALNFLAYLFAEQGQNLDEAEQLIQKALRLKPDDGYFVDTLGWIHFKKHRYKEAVNQLQRAAQLLPQEGVVLDHLGDTYERLGEHDKAIELYKKSLTLKLEEADRSRIENKLKSFERNIPTNETEKKP